MSQNLVLFLQLACKSRSMSISTSENYPTLYPFLPLKIIRLMDLQVNVKVGFINLHVNHRPVGNGLQSIKVGQICYCR